MKKIELSERLIEQLDSIIIRENKIYKEIGLSKLCDDGEYESIIESLVYDYNKQARYDDYVKEKKQ